jgi:serine/threonine protein kinase
MLVHCVYVIETLHSAPHLPCTTACPQATAADCTLQVVKPLLEVLARLHAAGIVHRDIKPENLFFTATGALLLGDFGLAIDTSQGAPRTRLGTPDYLAPEVSRPEQIQ